MLEGQNQPAQARRRMLDRYQRPLIVTDLDSAAVLAPIFERLESGARIVLLGTYRIPHQVCRLLLRTGRLERELEMCRRDEASCDVIVIGRPGTWLA